MEWHYAIDNQQKGPVDGTQLRVLFNSGVVNQNTLVWRTGMANWEPYSAVAAEVERSCDVEKEGKVEDYETCAYSGEPRLKSEMIPYGDHWVAAEHKDAFVQGLQEGRGVALGERMTNMQYVGFWWRVPAKIIDTIITTTVMFLCFLPLLFALWPYFSWLVTGQSGPEPDIEKKLGLIIVLGILGFGVAFGFFMFYATWFVGKYGATPGKMALGFKVVNADGTKVSYLKAFGRFWAEILHTFVFGMIGGVVSVIVTLPFAVTGEVTGGAGGGMIAAQIAGMVLQYAIGYAGYYTAGWTKEKTAVHDMICSTRVVRK